MGTFEFASAPFTAGQLNALVKIVGPDNVPGILDGTLKFSVKQPDLLKQKVVKGMPIPEPNIPASFNVLLNNLRGLALDIELKKDKKLSANSSEKSAP
jgi:hypothetical protein